MNLCSARACRYPSSSLASAAPFTTAGFTCMIERAAVGAGLDTGAIQGWLGHRSVTSSVAIPELLLDVRLHQPCA
jgi:hypothetical protein